ncbi:hypothetical protein GGS20DRAFT_491498 [Poronia punctata]|nr:hypothetical protein GGS20DRAFT_491498 [Poronia punctata]
MRATSLSQTALLLCLQTSLSSQLTIPTTTTHGKYPSHPTRTLGNVSVADTKLVREALDFAKGHTSSDAIWNHVMRGWLYGTLIISHNATLQSTVDPETHAIAAILHDLGWDQTANSSVISPDRRFEVDGAVAAGRFLATHTKWDDHRIQLVWDSIALHTQESIFRYKQDTVLVTGEGIQMDFRGASAGVTEEEYDAVLRAFPKTRFRETVNETFVWLCESKPETTYDTFMQPWGDNYVKNYSSQGNRAFDLISALPI